jgi:hypothetical protein
MDFVSVTEGAASEADWTTRLTPMIEGVGLRVRDGGSWMYVLFLLEVRQDHIIFAFHWILDVPS